MSLRSLTRPLRHGLLFAFLSVSTQLIRHLPLHWAQFLGEMTGGVIGRFCLFFHVQLAQDLSDRLKHVDAGNTAATQQLILACWRDLGRRAFEWLQGDARSLIELSPQVEAWCQFLASSPQSHVICLSAHFGHWELMAAQLAQNGVNFISAAAQERNGSVGQWLTQRRRALGVQTMHPRHAYRALSSFLRQGGIRSFLIDLPSTGASTRMLPFLGQDAPTLTLPSRLIDTCRQQGNPVILWIYSIRESDQKYHIYIEDLSSVQDPVFIATQRLEALIKSNPTQWIWLRDRWQKSPQK